MALCLACGSRVGLDLFPGMYLITSAFSFRILIQCTASEYDNMAPPGEVLRGVNERGFTCSARPLHPSYSFLRYENGLP
jgi:hypothetical protein